MKNLEMKALFVPHLNIVQCTISTANYEKWLQEEGKIFSELSEKVVHNGVTTTITLSESWFDICKRYCRILLTDVQTHCYTESVLSTGAKCTHAA